MSDVHGVHTRARILSWRAHAALFDAGYWYARQQLETSQFDDLCHRAAA